ncbi:MAG TPA: DUF4386 family protein [Acidimicrobiales bacterium]|nr:DUF4386 family protein [Acidimicrobiales bacterium]HWI05507.1 DUF4386 family protein [Acidimicrobiales bacterium]
MRTSGTDRSTAIAGTAFAALFVGVFAMGGEAPEETVPAAEVIAYYNEHASQLRLGGYVMLAAAVLLLFFAGGLRSALTRHRGTTDDRLSVVAFGGAVVYAVGHGVMVVSSMALVAAADTGNADAVTALNVLDNKTFPLFMVGLSAMMLATGLCALQAAVLPRWLAWTSIVLGVLAVAGPGGYAAFFGFPFWVVAVGVSLARQQAPAEVRHDALR